MSANAAAGSLPGSLVVSTVKAAILFTTPEAAAVSSASAAVLAEGVLKSMFLSKLKLATAFVMVAFGLAVVTGGPAYHSLTARGAEIEVADDQKKADPDDKPHAARKKARGQNQEHIQGSGKAVTKEMNLSDFTAVDVRTVFQVEITRADEFRTSITADDNLFPHIKVVKEGSTLRISLDTKGKSISTKNALKATIAMPALDAVTLGGASQATFRGFKSAKNFKIKVTSASRLDGEIAASQLDIEATDAATATLKGSAKKARLSAIQASSLHLGDLALDQADVTLKNASTAAINVSKKLDYELTNASRLLYRGNPNIGKHEVSGASSVSRKPAAQGKKRASSTLTFPHDEAAFRDHLRSIHANVDHLRELHERMDHHKRMHPFVHTAAESAAPADTTPPARLNVGDKVPDFTLNDQGGKTVKLSDLQKDVKRTKKGIVVLSFWCSFCGSCRRVEHRLDKLAKDYEGQALVLALDASAGETAKRVNDALKKEGLSLPVILDPPGHTADLFGTEVTTTTVVIDGEGVLRYCGRFNNGERIYAEDALKAVLAGKEVAVKTTPHDGCRIVRK
jgi:thiol-disulfide isomerase/thioredoxin